MLDKIRILAPAKLNIFFRILGRRNDGFHKIRSGITFINLFDVLEIKKSHKSSITYSGLFKPKNGKYNDCIISKTLNFLSLSNLKLEINVEKNIPVQGGLGSASSNAAGLIRGLIQMNLITEKKYHEYFLLGADVPCSLFNKNCLVLGRGEKIFLQSFPKYYFLIIKPNFNNSTKEMYRSLNLKPELIDEEIPIEEMQINIDDTGNDFEKIILQKNKNFNDIFDFLSNLENSIFTRMTGSGSCFYSVFEKKEHAIKAEKKFNLTYLNLWTYVAENNIINN